MTKESHDATEGKNMDKKKPYDLEERTALFGEVISGFVKKRPVNPVTFILRHSFGPGYFVIRISGPQNLASNHS